MANFTPITYGPNENCNLSNCDPTTSLYGYRPSLGANVTFLVLFALTMSIHVVQGLKWREFFFLFAVFWGCVSEIIGYGGRIMLWQNPFSFDGFLIQIICITIGPAFFSAAIYLTLAKIINYLDRDCARFPPKWFYYIFIPCDVVSLTLQAAGGALSSSTTGSSQTGVDISLAGLSFQVFTLTLFTILAIDYAVRYLRTRSSRPQRTLPLSFKVFLSFLSLSIVCILIRCAYRIDELSNGYNGPLIHKEGLFIGLEGVMIIIAVFALNFAHPGPVFHGSAVGQTHKLSQDTDAPVVDVEK